MQSQHVPLTTSLLGRLQHRKHRDQTGLYFVEGARMVAAALQSGAPVEALVTCAPLLTSPRARDLAGRLVRRGAPCLEVSIETFRALSRRDGPQGIGAILRQRWEALDRIDVARGGMWVALHAVSNPGNLGMVLRTCDAVGCDGVILLDRTADPHDPTALKASTGAIFTQRLVRAEFRAFAAWAGRTRSTIVGTSPSAATDYRAVAYRVPIVLLMGSEQHGLSPDQQALCDAVVTIPMRGRSDSLNLAVATSIVLYEFQRHQCPAGEARAPPAVVRPHACRRRDRGAALEAALAPQDTSNTIGARAYWRATAGPPSDPPYARVPSASACGASTSTGRSQRTPRGGSVSESE